MPFIFNRIKPGYCPENDVRLGKDPLQGAVCSVLCLHDYDCKNDRVCVSSASFFLLNSFLPSLIFNDLEESVLYRMVYPYLLTYIFLFYDR